MSEWKPIATAPKDGSPALFYAPGSKSKMDDECDRTPVTRVDRWREGAWWSCRPRNPYTHWMPIPAPPVTD